MPFKNVSESFFAASFVSVFVMRDFRNNTHPLKSVSIM